LSCAITFDSLDDVWTSLYFISLQFFLMWALAVALLVTNFTCWNHGVHEHMNWWNFFFDLCWMFYLFWMHKCDWLHVTYLGCCKNSNIIRSEWIKLIATINNKTIANETLPSKRIQTFILIFDLQCKFIKHTTKKRHDVIHLWEV
jgi:hypothetical protein